MKRIAAMVAAGEAFDIETGIAYHIAGNAAQVLDVIGGDPVLVVRARIHHLREYFGVRIDDIDGAARAMAAAYLKGEQWGAKRNR